MVLCYEKWNILVILMEGLAKIMNKVVFCFGLIGYKYGKLSKFAFKRAAISNIVDWYSGFYK